MFALTAPVLIGAMGVAVDVSQMMLARSELSSIIDSATLSASKALSEQGKTDIEAKLMAEELIVAYASQSGLATSFSPVVPDVKIKTSIDANGVKVYDVTITASQDFKLSPLMKVFGKQSAKIAASTASRSSPAVKNKMAESMSMFLVLDKSGSMQASTTTVKSTTVGCQYTTVKNNTLNYSGVKTPCYYTQIEALKRASANLFKTFDTNDKEMKYVRVGAVSYDSAAQKASDLAWGTANAMAYINKLDANGGTSSTNAFKAAYAALSNAEDNNAHKAKNGLVPKKSILFMTDGTNSASNDDKLTLSLCKQAKTAGITVYAVAFNAPAAAKLFLRECATGTSTYFDADNGEELIAAFDIIAKTTAAKVPLLTN